MKYYTLTLDLDDTTLAEWKCKLFESVGRGETLHHSEWNITQQAQGAIWVVIKYYTRGMESIAPKIKSVAQKGNFAITN